MEEKTTLAPSQVMATATTTTATDGLEEEREGEKVLTRMAEVYENERYQLSSMNWSSHGLLINDRGAYSTRDGRVSWANLEQAGEGLSSKGWCWGENSWAIDYTDADHEGWIYGSNFDTIETHGSSTKNISHFVRRRRRIRKQIFVVGAIGGTCDYCDSTQISVISNKLLDTLCQASLNEYPGQEPPPDPLINRLKDHLMDMIGLGSIARNPPNMQFTLKDILHKLDKFSSYVLEKKSLWSKAASMFTPEYTPEFFPQRSEVLRNGVFTDVEREVIACALIRKYDTEYKYHCDRVNCGQQCIYSIHVCPNPGCTVKYSLKYQAEHNDTCPFRVISCPRDCGESHSKQDMKIHLEEYCVKRPVSCPYCHVGCPYKELMYCDLSSHLESSVQYHLLVLTQHTIEQSQVMQKMQRKIMELEDHYAHQSTLVSSLQSTCANTVIQVRNIEKALDERDASAGSELANQNKKLESDLVDLRKELTNLRLLCRTIERDTNAAMSINQLANGSSHGKRSGY